MKYPGEVKQPSFSYRCHKQQRQLSLTSCCKYLKDGSDESANSEKSAYLFISPYQTRSSGENGETASLYLWRRRNVKNRKRIVEMN